PLPGRQGGEVGPRRRPGLNVGEWALVGERTAASRSATGRARMSGRAAARNAPATPHVRFACGGWRGAPGRCQMPLAALMPATPLPFESASLAASRVRAPASPGTLVGDAGWMLASQLAASG